jgi:hypothetical protein
VRDNAIQDGIVEFPGMAREISRRKAEQPLKGRTAYRQVQPVNARPV